MYFFIEINSAIQMTLHYILTPIAPFTEQTISVKTTHSLLVTRVQCTFSSFLFRLSETFYRRSVFDTSWVFGSKTPILKNACWYGIQKSLALISSRALFDVLTKVLIFSPVNDGKPVFFQTSLQTSFIKSTSTSLISLFHVTKPPFNKKKNVVGCSLIQLST